MLRHERLARMDCGNSRLPACLRFGWRGEAGIEMESQ